ncbi:hypothetical protein D9757_007917 [Collybiopsis confluens]|uniref:CENP-V/GFA domain-containing protein n=1 Tax=Collybiopsis confluens TaxID=2823264 RepID=A0A8H5HBQ2_9AGAR|nr:hypothetical protein D9757_011218 [Collybiopsis confluens]KAF5380299.1 hypothetical protein D9757_007917 [Collybiopsis confluens]
MSFTLKSGKELLKVYYDPNTDTGKPLARHFCSNCGSNVYFRMSPELPRSDIYIVHGPGIEGHETWYPRKHTHADNKLPYIGNIEMRAKEKSRM